MPEEEQAARRPKGYAPPVISVVVIAFLAVLYFFSRGFKSFTKEANDNLSSNNQEKIKQWITDFAIWGPFSLIVAMVLQMFLVVVPSFGLMNVAVLAYGPVWESVISIVTVLTTSSVRYIIGQSVSRVTMDRIIGSDSRAKVSMFYGITDYGL